MAMREDSSSKRKQDEGEVIPFDKSFFKYARMEKLCEESIKQLRAFSFQHDVYGTELCSFFHRLVMYYQNTMKFEEREQQRIKDREEESRDTNGTIEREEVMPDVFIKEERLSISPDSRRTRVRFEERLAPQENHQSASGASFNGGMLSRRVDSTTRRRHDRDWNQIILGESRDDGGATVIRQSSVPCPNGSVDPRSLTPATVQAEMGEQQRLADNTAIPPSFIHRVGFHSTLRGLKSPIPDSPNFVALPTTRRLPNYNGATCPNRYDGRRRTGMSDTSQYEQWHASTSTASSTASTKRDRCKWCKRSGHLSKNCRVHKAHEEARKRRLENEKNAIVRKLAHRYSNPATGRSMRNGMGSPVYCPPSPPR